MAIRITCPGCQTPLTLADTMRGKKVRCKSCAKVLGVPAANGKAKSLARPLAPSKDDEPEEDRDAKAEVDDTQDEERPAKKKKKKQKGKKGSGLLIIGAVAAVAVLLIGGGTLWAVMRYLPDAAEKKKREEALAKAAEGKGGGGGTNAEPDNRSPARIVVPGIKEGNPAAKKGGTYVISNVRGAGYRAERQSELANIAKSYVQYCDEYKGANRNMDTWLQYIKTYGPIHDAVKEGYYKMNFSARPDGSSVIAYERDMDNGQKHLCAFYSGTVDYVPLADLKMMLGRDP